MIIFKCKNSSECEDFKIFFEGSDVKSLFGNCEYRFLSGDLFPFSIRGVPKCSEKQAEITVDNLVQKYHLIKEVATLKATVKKLSIESYTHKIARKGYRPYHVKAKIEVVALVRNSEHLSSEHIFHNITEHNLSGIISEDVKVLPLDINSKVQLKGDLLNSEPYCEDYVGEASCNDILEAIDNLEL